MEGEWIAFNTIVPLFLVLLVAWHVSTPWLNLECLAGADSFQYFERNRTSVNDIVSRTRWE